MKLTPDQPLSDDASTCPPRQYRVGGASAPAKQTRCRRDAVRILNPGAGPDKIASKTAGRFASSARASGKTGPAPAARPAIFGSGRIEGRRRPGEIMKRREFVKTIGLGAAGIAAGGRFPGCSAARTSARPNILFIMSDDHASHAVGAYGSRLHTTPNVDRIAAGGMRFDNCFCTNGICAPSRAVILTGKHSHMNGLRDNAAAFDGGQPTLPKILGAAGYATALFGKWHLKSDPTGFDHWDILPGQGDYYNPDFITNGERVRVEGYVSDIVTDKALAWLRGRDAARPFFMMLHHKAPHRNWQPAPRHLHLFDGVRFPEPPTLFDDYATRSRAALEQEMTLRDHMTIESDLKMGPAPARLNEEQERAWEEAYAPRRAAFRDANPRGDDLVRWKYQRYMEDYLGCVAAVDENIGRVLHHLEETGLDENTLVVYTSDQGFFLGDHGWFDKRFMYEEALRMPLVARLPGRIPAGSTSNALVQNLDFAPTFLALAGLKTPADMQGRSFAAVLEGRPDAIARDSIYYHYYEFPAVHQAKRHFGVRTRRHKLLRFYDDIDAWELYDLEADPHELRNVYGDPAYAAVTTELKAELARLQTLYGDSEELALRMAAEDRRARAK
jgi:arylsulfatase A-like enzyme